MKNKLDHTYLARSIGLINPKVPEFINKETTIYEAANKLAHSNVGAMLVLDENDNLAGIFTERDIVKKVITNNIPFSNKASEVMTTDPISIEMTTPIGFALQLMTEGGFRNLPIVDVDNNPIGVISIKDIMDEFVRTFVIDAENLV